MNPLYQIFPDALTADIPNTAIDELLGFPNGAQRYRENIIHPVDFRSADAVTDYLINACVNMDPLERYQYYDSANLFDFQYLIDEGWFPPLY